MYPALIEGNLSTALYHKYYSLAGNQFPLRNDVWFVLMHVIDAKRPGGEPSANPDHEWLAGFVHGEPLRPAGYSAPAFKAYHSQEYESRERRWRRELFDVVSREFGVQENEDWKCWTVRESQVDG